MSRFFALTLQISHSIDENERNSTPMVLAALPTPMLILFLHGWQSIPGGVKPTFLAQHGHTILNPALPDEDFAAALAIAQAEYDQHKPDVVVGSSRGGALAMNLNAGDTPLVLLCPAWKKYGTAKTIRANSTILH